MAIPKLSNMRIKPRLTLLFGLLGLIPVAIAAVVLTSRASSEIGKMGGAFGEAMSQQVFDRLGVVRDSKKEAIESYFETIASQARTLAEDAMVIGAMGQFSSSFDTYREELGIDAQQLADMRASVAQFHREQFDTTYQADNGKSSNPDSLVAKLGDDAVALQYTFITNNPNPVGSKDTLVDSGGGTAYAARHALVHESLRAFQQEFGFYDVFLVCAEHGDIVYTVFKEIDFASSLKDGPYANTNIAAVYKQAMGLPKGEVAFADFKTYTPSYGAPASFAGTGIWNGGEAIGVLMFQMPIDRITQVMSARVGLGESGESILVGMDGLMRSDSYHEPERLSVVNSFKQSIKADIDPQILELANSGEPGQATYTDNAGTEMLVAYAQVDVFDGKWNIFADLSQEEAFAAVVAANTGAEKAKANFLYWGIGIGLLALVAVLLVGPRVAKSIANPLSQAVEVIEGLADGDLSRSLDIDSTDELGQMATALSTAIEGMRDAVQTEKVDWKKLGEQRKEVGRISSMVENSSLGMLFADTDGVIRYLNPAVAQAFESVANHMSTEPSGLLGGSVQQLHSDPEVQHFANADPKELPWSKSISIGAESVDLNAVAIFDADGEHIGTMTTWDFVTERVAAIEAEQKTLSEERMALDRAQAEELQVKVDSLLDAVTSAAAGDLTTEITVSGADAIGQMGDGLAAFLSGLRTDMSEIGTTTEQLSASAMQMSATSEELGANANETSGQATGAASAAEEVSVNVQSVAAGTEQLAQSIREIAQNASEAARVAREAVTVTEGTAAVVSQLGESSIEIGNVLKMISSISEQTNLLALNATIEAARAGEAGKGFAVVANEVKELAAETAKATEEISGRVEKIQKDAAQSTDAIGKVASVINQINDISSTIASAVEEQTAVTGEMGRSVTEASEGTNEISQAIGLVAQAAESTSVGVNDSNEVASNVAGMASTLRALVDKFTV